jgi:hypothetical protein
MFRVPGVDGKERPFFVGEWTDANGFLHRSGMADLLLQPTVHVKVIPKGETKAVMMNCTVPLWVEAKSGSGVLTAEQKNFQTWVTSIGAGYLCVTDSCEQLMEWFKEYGVKKR